VVSARTATGDHAVFETQRNNGIMAAFGIDDSGSYTNATVGSSAFLGTNGVTLHFVTGPGFTGSAGNITTGGAWTLTGSSGATHTLRSAGTSAIFAFGRMTSSAGFGCIGADVTDAFKLYSGGVASDNPVLGSQIGAVTHAGAWTLGPSGASDTTEHLVHGRLRPAVDSTYNLGYTNLRWTAVYCLNSSIQTASDSRLKQNIQPMSPTLNKICQLVPSVWEDKYESFKTEKSGFVAQELEQVFPELVNTTGVSVEGHDDIKHISLGGAPTVAILVKAIQELKAELDVAKARIEAMESGN
jgi:hypothetical protein